MDEKKYSKSIEGTRIAVMAKRENKIFWQFQKPAITV